jgi:hypothetical protein
MIIRCFKIVFYVSNFLYIYIFFLKCMYNLFNVTYTYNYPFTLYTCLFLNSLWFKQRNLKYRNLKLKPWASKIKEIQNYYWFGRKTSTANLCNIALGQESKYLILVPPKKKTFEFVRFWFLIKTKKIWSLDPGS